MEIRMGLECESGSGMKADLEYEGQILRLMGDYKDVEQNEVGIPNDNNICNDRLYDHYIMIMTSRCDKGKNNQRSTILTSFKFEVQFMQFI